MEAGEEVAKKMMTPDVTTLREAWAIAKAIWTSFKAVDRQVKDKGVTAFRNIRQILREQYRVALLNDRAHGDLHQVQVNDHLVGAFHKELLTSYVDHAMECGVNGMTYVHFMAKDADLVHYCLNKAQGHLNLVSSRADRKTPEAGTMTPRTQDAQNPASLTHGLNERDVPRGAQAQDQLSTLDASDQPGEIGMGSAPGQDTTQRKPARFMTKRTRSATLNDLRRRTEAIKARSLATPTATPKIPSPKL